jgi:hypothetical protein
MKRIAWIISLAATTALSGCGNENHNIVAGGADPDEVNIPTNTSVELPPAVVAAKTYRCADNSVVHVDWLSDGKSANIRPDKSTSSTQVTATEAGKPMVGPAGYSVEGSSTASSVKIAVPGHPAQSCKA